jgi:protein-S-isoprenylcysteine O-methyltransferase Ste14
MPQNIGIEIFANWQTLVLALGIFVATYVIRLGIQTMWKSWKENKFYNEFILHILPIAIALAIALFAKKFPWPNEAFTTSASVRCFYACFIGMTCGLFYGRVRAAIGLLNTGVKLPAATDVVPEPPTDEVKIAEVKPADKDSKP